MQYTRLRVQYHFEAWKLFCLTLCESHSYIPVVTACTLSYATSVGCVQLIAAHILLVNYIRIWTSLGTDPKLEAFDRLLMLFFLLQCPTLSDTFVSVAIVGFPLKSLFLINTMVIPRSEERRME